MGDKNLPTLSARSAVRRLPEVTGPRGNGHAGWVFHRVRDNLLFPEVAEAAVRVMTRNGVEVVIPRGRCAAASGLFFGDYRNALRLAEKNLSVFRGLAVDCIVTDCSSCATALKHETRELLRPAPFEVPGTTERVPRNED